MRADEKGCEQYLAAWDAYKAGDKKIVKFVPASGAASRMFKNMFEFLGAEYDKPTTDFEKKFFDHIHDFAFYNDLNAACLDNTGKNINALLSEHNYKAVVSNLLESAGLNYGALPKGLLKFHRYADGVRTPLEEHLVEAHCMLPEDWGSGMYTSLFLPNTVHCSKNWCCQGCRI